MDPLCLLDLRGPTRAMVAISLLCCLNLTVDGLPSMETDDCSYFSLLRHLNLSEKSDLLASIRPVLNWTTPTQVKVDMFILGILDVSEKSQTFTCLVDLAISWFTEILSWDPKAFCGIKRISVPREKLWHPDIVTVEDISDSSSFTPGRYAMVHPGLTKVMDRHRLTTICEMDLYKFPFDTQNCNITFQSVLHKVQEIEVGAFTEEEVMDEMTRGSVTSLGEWDFLGIVMTESGLKIGESVWDQLIYQVTVKRRPLLYVINLLVPITFFLVLDLASFFVSGDKLSFKVTILLSISVLLLILNDILPSTAHHLPLIAVYCTIIFTLVGLGLLESMLVIFLVELDSRVGGGPHTQNKAPSRVGGGPQTQNMAPAQDNILEETSGHKGPLGDMARAQGHAEAYPEKRAPDGGGLSLSDPRVLELVLEGVRRVRLEGSPAGGAGDQGTPGYWERVARRIDAAYNCAYLLTTITFLLCIYVKWFN